MSDQNDIHAKSRYKRRAKRRMFDKLIIGLVSAMVILLLFLGWNLFFDEKDDGNLAEPASVSPSVNQSDNDQSDTTSSQDQNSTDDTNRNSGPNNEKTAENNSQTDSSLIDVDDPNVIGILQGPWEPIGTVQDEPHTISWDMESIDWAEMEKAVAYATSINLDDMITWWVKGNGEGKVLAEVSTGDKSLKYHVYLEWITNNGWKPTKVYQVDELVLWEEQGNDS